MDPSVSQRCGGHKQSRKEQSSSQAYHHVRVQTIDQGIRRHQLVHLETASEGLLFQEEVQGSRNVRQELLGHLARAQPENRRAPTDHNHRRREEAEKVQG